VGVTGWVSVQRGVLARDQADGFGNLQKISVTMQSFVRCRRSTFDGRRLRSFVDNFVRCSLFVADFVRCRLRSLPTSFVDDVRCSLFVVR